MAAVGWMRRPWQDPGVEVKTKSARLDVRNTETVKRVAPTSLPGVHGVYHPTLDRCICPATPTWSQCRIPPSESWSSG